MPLKSILMTTLLGSCPTSSVHDGAHVYTCHTCHTCHTCVCWGGVIWCHTHRTHHTYTQCACHTTPDTEWSHTRQTTNSAEDGISSMGGCMYACMQTVWEAPRTMSGECSNCHEQCSWSHEPCSGVFELLRTVFVGYEQCSWRPRTVFVKPRTVFVGYEQCSWRPRVALGS